MSEEGDTFAPDQTHHVPRLLKVAVIPVAVAGAALFLGVFRDVFGSDTDSGDHRPPTLSLDSPDLAGIRQAVVSGSIKLAELDRDRKATGHVTEIEFTEPVRSRGTAGGGAVGSAGATIDYARTAPRQYTAHFVYEDGSWELRPSSPIEPSRARP